MKEIFFLILFLASVSQAYFDVSCWENNCLKNGWTKTEAMTGAFLDHQCYGDGCEKSGWIVGGSMNDRYFTQCKEGACFVAGWYEIQRETHQLLANITCNEKSCLRNGWSRSQSRGSQTAICNEGSCTTMGWSVQGAGFANEVILCKSENCFRNGWIESVQ